MTPKRPETQLKEKIKMKEEAKELRKNALDDSELDQVAGGSSFNMLKRECAKCRKSLTIDEIVIKEINGECKPVCIDCARKL